MRYSRPFGCNLLVVRDSGTVVLFVKLHIRVGQRLGREGFALLLHIVAYFLEFGKHGLAEQRGAEHVEIVRQQIFFHFFVGRGGKQILEKQHFVYRGSHFRNEYGVAGFTVRLSVIGVIAVHGMPQLVRYREYVVNGCRIVEKHKRLGGIRTPAVRAATLVFCFVHVHPALVVSFLQQSRVLVAHYRKPFFDEVERFFKRKRHIRAFHYRHIHIVHIESFDAERGFSVRDVIVNVLAVFVHAFDKVGVNAFGYVFVEHGSFEAAFISSCRSREHVAFDRACVHSRQCVEKAFVALVIGGESGFSDVLIGALQQLRICSVRKLYFLAVNFNRAELHVHVVDFRERALELRQRRLHHGHKFFFLFAESVLFSAQNAFKHVVVIGKIGIGNKAFDVFFVQRAQFGIYITACRRILDEQRLRSVGKTCIKIIGRILIEAHFRVRIQFFQFDFDLVALFKQFEQFYFVGKLAFVSRHKINAFVKLFVVFFPKIVGGVHVFERPQVFFFDFGSLHKYNSLMVFCFFGFSARRYAFCGNNCAAFYSASLIS